MYDDEHPLQIALAWLLAGFICGVYILVKLGGAKVNVDRTEALFNKTPMHYSPELD